MPTNRILAKILLIITSVSQLSFPQEINNSINRESMQNPGIFSAIKIDFDSGISDVFSTMKRPLEFEGSDWLKLGAIIGATGFFMTQDDRIRNAVKTQHSSKMDNIVDIGEYYGGPERMLIIPGGIYLSGLIFNIKSFRTTGRILTENLLLTGIFVQVLKISFGRSRPYTGRGSHFFSPFTFHNDNNSFPSGHTIVAFSTSSVLAERIDNIYASIGLYGLASLTAYQRIYSDNHWFSDTFLSAAIGICIGKYIVKINEEKATETYDFSFEPLISPDFKGIGLTFSF